MAKFKKNKSGDLPAISTASLPDIVFMLLFFFMVATVMRDSTLMVQNTLPAADQVQKLDKKDRVIYIYAGKPSSRYIDTYGTSAKIQLNDKFGTVEEVGAFVLAERAAKRQELQNVLTTALKVDSDTKMGIISDIKQELRKVNALKLNYTTRVGEGPFPTELTDDVGELLGTRGKEFGTVTSRKRRCGWFDGVLVRQTIKISGIDGIALTKLDVLDELDEIKMCIEYELDGKKIDYLPAAVEDQLKIKPIYKIFPGWKTSTNGIKDMDALPENAKKYIHAVEEFIGAKVSSVSTSPERDDTILVENPFDI